MVTQDGEGTVDLLGEQDAGEFVRPGHCAEGEKKVGLFPLGGSEAFVSADQKDEVLPLHFGVGEKGGEAGRVHGLAGGIEVDLPGRGVTFGNGELPGVNLAHLAGGEAGGAVEELLGGGAQACVLGAADVVYENLQRFPFGIG